MYTDGMRALRRMIGPIAAGWLLCQAATLVLVTAAFGFDVAAVRLLECTCAHGAGHTDCPMHHQSGAPRDGLSQVQCADQADAAILGSLLGHVGLAPSPVSVLPSTSTGVAAPMAVTTRILRPAPPDPPPPRA